MLYDSSCSTPSRLIDGAKFLRVLSDLVRACTILSSTGPLLYVVSVGPTQGHGQSFLFCASTRHVSIKSLRGSWSVLRVRTWSIFLYFPMHCSWFDCRFSGHCPPDGRSTHQVEFEYSMLWSPVTQLVMDSPSPPWRLFHRLNFSLWVVVCMVFGWGFIVWEDALISAEKGLLYVHISPSYYTTRTKYNSRVKGRRAPPESRVIQLFLRPLTPELRWECPPMGWICTGVCFQVESPPTSNHDIFSFVFLLIYITTLVSR